MPSTMLRNMNTKTLLYSKLKPQAIELRKQGMTYPEIIAKIGPVPKNTLSNWLKNTKLGDEQIERIKQYMKERGNAGRQAGAWANKKRRIDRLAKLKNAAETEYSTFSEQPMFLAGLVLYLAEGSKKWEAFHFMNSDPYLIKIMVRWILNYSDVEFRNIHFRLYIHEVYKNEDCESYWMNELGLKPEQLKKTIYKPTGRENKKNPAYRGCLRIEPKGNSDIYWKTLAWRDCLYKSMG